MFDDPFVFFALAIAIVALIFARKAMNQVAELRQRLEAIEAARGGRRCRRASTAPPFAGVRADPATGFARGRTGSRRPHSGCGIHRARRDA